MKRKTLSLVAALAVTLAALLITAATLAKTPQDRLSSQNAVWVLTKLEVVDPGKTAVIEEGKLTTGYTLSAKARSKAGSLVPEGTFVLTLDAFTPAREMPGQKPGVWYVRGNWTITKKDALLQSAKARHSPDVARGTISAELPFNPAESQEGWSALATLPMSPAAGRWGRGQGSLNFLPDGGAHLVLRLTLWPENQ